MKSVSFPMLSLILLLLLSCGTPPRNSDNRNARNSNQSQSGMTEQEKAADKQPATKLGAFLAKKGELIVKTFYELGTVKGKYGTKALLTAVVAYEPGKEDERVRGLRIEISQPGLLARSNASALDLEEIESLSKAIEYMLNLIAQWKGTNRDNTEVMFSTKDNFQIGFNQNTSPKKLGEMDAGLLSGYSGVQSGCIITVDQLNEVKALVEKGLQVLNQK